MLAHAVRAVSVGGALVVLVTAALLVDVSDGIACYSCDGTPFDFCGERFDASAEQMYMKTVEEHNTCYTMTVRLKKNGHLTTRGSGHPEVRGINEQSDGCQKSDTPEKNIAVCYCNTDLCNKDPSPRTTNQTLPDWSKKSSTADKTHYYCLLCLATAVVSAAGTILRCAA